MSLHRLPNALENEKSVLFLRRHWIELLHVFFYLIVLVAIPFALLFTTRLTGLNLLQGTIAPFVVVGLSIYAIFTFIIFITQFTDFYLDTWIVTTDRIINIEQHGLFSRLVSEVQLNEIQDVTSETKGFLETFLTYGDVYIQTAAERERFNFKNIDNPDSVKATIVKLVQDCRARHRNDQTAQVQTAIDQAPRTA